MSENKLPIGKDEADWMNALDEWDAQIDDAVLSEAKTADASPATTAPDPLLTEVSLEALPTESPMPLEPAPLDEPPPFEGLDLPTALQQTLPPVEDMLFPVGVDELDVVDDTPEPMGDQILLENPIDEEEDNATGAYASVEDVFGGSTRAASDLELQTLLQGEALPLELDPALDDAPAPPPDVEISIEEGQIAEDRSAPIVLTPLASEPQQEAEEVPPVLSVHNAITGEEPAQPTPEVFASVPAPEPPPVDEDFYDDISIVQGREEPSNPKPEPVAPTPAAVEEVPLWEEPLVARSESDPDRTPLPIDEDISGAVMALRMPLTSEHTALPQHDLVAKRPQRPSEVTRLDAESAAPLVMLDEERRELRGLLDTERLLAEPSRAPELAYEAAWLSSRIADDEGALERADVVLATHPSHRGALALARRAAMARRDMESVADLLGREREGASLAERRAFGEWGVAVADARAMHAEARALEGEPLAIGAALSGLAFSPSSKERIDAARTAVAGGDPRLAASLEVWAARHAAVDRVQEHLFAARTDLRSFPAALQAWRLSIRQEGAGEAAALDLLADALPPSALRSAIERRAASAHDPAEARERLGHLADAADDLAAVWWSLDPIEPGAGDVELARVSRALSVVNDPGQRAALHVALGAAEEARDHVGAALAAYEEAAREMSADLRAERALERVRSRGGDKQAELTRQLRIASLGDRRAPWALYRAAALLLELDRPEEALARADEALERAPNDGETLALAVRIAVLLGRPLVGADKLSTAADSTLDGAFASALRRRAAVLLSTAGSPAPAIEAALESGGSADERLDVVRRLGTGASSRLRDALEELSESASPDAIARARFERATLEPSSAAEELRRVVELRPDDAGAIGWATRLLRAEAPAASTELLVASAGERRDALLDAVLALADDQQDPAAAGKLLANADDPVLVAERTRLYRALGRGPELGAAYDAALEDVGAPERRAVMLADAGRAYQRGGETDRALERYRLAYEALPEAPVYRDLLERALERAGDTARLADLALTDLREAPDARKKVQAYERLAFIDECLRGDLASARMSYESIAELDQNAQDAARRLERYLIGEKRGVDLVHLYESLGIAAQDEKLSVAFALERARLRRRVAGELDPAELESAVENDLRLALFKDPRNRGALREAYARATEKRDTNRRLELATRLADVSLSLDPPDSRAAALFGLRSAESALRLGREDDGLERLRAITGRPESQLPALVTLLELALKKGELAVAADAAEQIQRVQREPKGRRQAGLLAASIVEKELNDPKRAAKILRAVLDSEPADEIAFLRLRQLFESQRDHNGLAELLGSRLRVETDGGKLLSLRVALAKLLREQVGDLSRARNELVGALRQDPNHAEALSLLAEIERTQGNHQAAADLLLRRARIEKSRPVLADLLFQLSQLYALHVKDDKRAIQCLTRVLQLQPDRKEVLELAADVFAREWDWLGALGVLQRLASIETDFGKRVGWLHRAAQVQEEGFKEPRQALTLYRAALELNPTFLPAVEALAKFHDRQSDLQSLRVLVDTTARRLRAGLSGGPRDAGTFHALFRIFGLRRAPDRQAMTAGVLDWMGACEPEEKAALERLKLREQYPGASLADPSLDDYLFDGRVPAGVRNVLRLIEEPVMKTLRADVKVLGVQRADKLPKSGHAVRDVGNRIAADLGLRDFDLYVTPALKKAAVLELTDPYAMCIGSGLLEGAHELELRFLFARFFKMAQLRLALALRIDSQALAALVAGVVRQYVPDFQPAGIDAGLIAAEAARLGKSLSKKLVNELHPFALECASPSFDLLAIGPGVNAAADRAGLLAASMPAPALTMLERMGAEGAARALALFAAGDELPEMRRIAGTSIG